MPARRSTCGWWGAPRDRPRRPAIRCASTRTATPSFRRCWMPSPQRGPTSTLPRSSTSPGRWRRPSPRRSAPPRHEVSRCASFSTPMARRRRRRSSSSGCGTRDATCAGFAAPNGTIGRSTTGAFTGACSLPTAALASPAASASPTTGWAMERTGRTGAIPTPASPVRRSPRCSARSSTHGMMQRAS